MDLFVCGWLKILCGLGEIFFLKFGGVLEVGLINRWVFGVRDFYDLVRFDGDFREVKGK